MYQLFLNTEYLGAVKSSFFFTTDLNGGFQISISRSTRLFCDWNTSKVQSSEFYLEAGHYADDALKATRSCGLQQNMCEGNPL